MKIEGNMDIYSVSDIKSGLSKGFMSSSGIEIDMSEVSEIDTAGFQLLVLARREAGRTGKSFRIVAMSQPVSSVIELYKMENYLQS
jgi:anti-anti-sigma factor